MDDKRRKPPEHGFGFYLLAGWRDGVAYAPLPPRAFPRLKTALLRCALRQKRRPSPASWFGEDLSSLATGGQTAGTRALDVLLPVLPSGRRFFAFYPLPAVTPCAGGPSRGAAAFWKDRRFSCANAHSCSAVRHRPRRGAWLDALLLADSSGCSGSWSSVASLWWFQQRLPLRAATTFMVSSYSPCRPYAREPNTIPLFTRLVRTFMPLSFYTWTALSPPTAFSLLRLAEDDAAGISASRRYAAYETPRLPVVETSTWTRRRGVLFCRLGGRLWDFLLIRGRRTAPAAAYALFIGLGSDVDRRTNWTVTAVLLPSMTYPTPLLALLLLA